MSCQREQLLDLRDWIGVQLLRVQERIESSGRDRSSLANSESQAHVSLLCRLQGGMERLIAAIEADYG